MDYEGLCEDLLEMGRRAAFHASLRLNVGNLARAYELLLFAGYCHDFRLGLFHNGHGYGGY